MSNTDTIETAAGDWKYLCQELTRRTREPTKNFAFLVHVLLAIILFGGLGMWIEILKLVISPYPLELAGLITAVITFFPTLIGSTSLQLVLASQNNRIFMSFALLLLCTFTTFAILLPFFSVTHPVIVLVLGAACSLCAIWAWWITNGGDPIYKSTPPADAATGGSIDRKLPGTLEGFEV